MTTLMLCTCLLLLVGTVRASLDADADRLANAQSDLVRQTFDVIDQAIEAQHEMFDERIEALEGRVAELERIIAEGVPAVEPDVPPVQPEVPEPQPEPTPEPEPEPEPEPPTTTTTTTAAPTTVKTEPPPPAVTTPETCQDLFERGETTNGMYMIDPQDLGAPFEIMCSFDGGEVQTMVHHDSESEVRNKNNKGPGDFVLTPTYNNADMSQIAALIQASSSCRQFIKLRCKASVLFAKKGTDYGWWISRDGVTVRSWGGTPASETSRACAGGASCNCDAGSKSETADEGQLTDKDYLPVQSVYLGDSSGNKKTSWLTLGPLICTGNM